MMFLNELPLILSFLSLLAVERSFVPMPRYISFVVLIWSLIDILITLY